MINITGKRTSSCNEKSTKQTANPLCGFLSINKNKVYTVKPSLSIYVLAKEINKTSKYKHNEKNKNYRSNTLNP